ncbi:N-acylneuraminate-9-phosphatase [Petromyzon marinus]|uniref:N-acylneuraminate-9-phosphatase n=1 Tax=Petromyzon marinus TaxID=7757 RepID=A0AAJ7X3E9_PETMA|nr:N-acylneuraminate-9-phosphatase [Petromyzon marinus]
MDHVEAIIFDLDNTLVDTQGADVKAYEKIRKLLQSERPGRDPEPVVSHFRRALALMPSDPNASFPSTDAWRRELWARALLADLPSDPVAAAALAPACFALWNTTRLQNMRLSEAAHAMLLRLRASGRYRLALLTNGDGATQRAKVEACGCAELVDVVVFAGELPEEKPAPSAFHACCGLLGASPCRCVMVGDSLECDVRGAQAAGFAAAVWVRGSVARETIVDRDGGEGDGTRCRRFPVRSVVELEDVLRELEAGTPRP